ncbi:MAG: response regulator, partial [Desulfatiglandales bacterium]
MANVLIIDDDDMLCEMLSHAIGRMGHDVKCANTLKSGLHEVSADTFDLVFLDVGMPDGDGLNV